jgi:hypothetical protein
MLKKVIATILATTSAAYAYPSISEITAPPQVAMVDVKVDNGKAIPIEVVEKSWKCPGCNSNEKYVLAKLQESTNIRDRNALATIMGNIKSESNFHANICEGGARVPYEKCYRGGYGLIQWTTYARYKGLGNFCKKYGCNPSSIEGQTRYMINESQFQKILPEFEGAGQPGAYYWLGWGIKGYREQYAYNYTKKLVWS